MASIQLEIVALGEQFIPSRARPGDAGLDLRARLDAPIRLQRGSRVTVPTGIKIAIPPGFAGLICPRSGMAQDHGLSITNAPGLIDANYRGEVGVILEMRGDDWITINPGDRIAQMLIVPIAQVNVLVVESLDDTERGENGFGSSGHE